MSSLRDALRSSSRTYRRPLAVEGKELRMIKKFGLAVGTMLMSLVVAIPAAVAQTSYPPPTSPPPGDPSGGSSGGGTAFTGLDITFGAIVLVALVVVGLLALRLSRRKTVVG
jgi:hypothetical protein